MKTIYNLLPVLVLAITMTACGGEPPAEENMGAMQGTPAGAVAEPQMEDGVQVVRITVGPSGYEPERIQLEAGVPARLVFYRTVEGDCPEQVQIPDFGVGKTDLPLDQEHAIEFTPTKTGEFTFTCGMDMLEGTLVVES